MLYLFYEILWNEAQSYNLKMTSEGSRKQIENHALAYLKAVKDVFDDKKETYNSFLELMKNYRDKRFDHVVPLYYSNSFFAIYLPIIFIGINFVREN